MADNLPTGVELNGKQLRIVFMLEGKRCREPIKGIAKVNKASIAYADNKRRAIVAEIKEGRFDYAAHFPDSPRAALFSGHGGPAIKRTVKEGIDRWLEVQRAKKASSTIINYVSKSNHLDGEFGLRKIADVSKTDFELFQAKLLRSGLAAKTVNDIFTVARGVWSDAFGDGIVKMNPLERVKNIESDHDVEHADPFTREEIERIGSTDACPVTRMITFNCWAGLSLSEMAALAKEDVDLPAGIVRVRRAYVVGEYKVPKERARIRTIELIDPALQILKEIMRDAEDAEIETVSVTQRDNVSVKKESLRFLFKTPSERVAWTGRNISKWFTAHLEKAGVRHRGVNQCRHTFASQALSSYVPVEWVARQLGHSDTTMVKKHYGRWIPADTKSMAAVVSKMMGFTEQTSP